MELLYSCENKSKLCITLAATGPREEGERLDVLSTFRCDSSFFNSWVVSLASVFLSKSAGDGAKKVGWSVLGCRNEHVVTRDVFNTLKKRREVFKYPTFHRSYQPCPR